jgi:hypothetical protein
MNIGALLQSAIYLISSSMLYPAMALLVAGFVIAVASFGALIAEWAERARSKKTNSGGQGPLQKFDERSCGGALGKLDDILQKTDATWDDIENFWRGVRWESWKRLDYLRILVRLGPSMGLVGTLIPMSTGLASLSQGDTSRLSSDLVVAFSTTVVGLCSGVAANILYTIKSRWLEGDLDTLQVIIEFRAALALDKPDANKP